MIPTWWASTPPPARWLSDIPFSATVGAVRVGRVDGEFVINPTYSERAATTVNIMVVGHKDGIVMIESGAKEESEETILAAIEFGHTEIKKIARRSTSWSSWPASPSGPSRRAGV
jgi:polyribonucleotide nucleotidyltransferase